MLFAGAWGSGGATPATAAGCAGELHGLMTEPERASFSHSARVAAAEDSDSAA